VRQLGRGERVALADLLGADGPFELRLHAPMGRGASTIDWACFAVDGSGRLADDRWFVFYNQLRSPDGAVELVGRSPGGVLRVDPGALPTWAERLVVTAAIDGPDTMAELMYARAELAARGAPGATQGAPAVCRLDVGGGSFDTERAIIFAEVYRRDGRWRVSFVAQGFAGGMDALLEHFGGEVADAAPAPPAPPAPEAAPATEAPARLVSLAKAAQVSLAKRGLDRHTAQVALALDISLSMRRQYESGRIQRLAERVLALATRFDDDGQVEVFLFAGKAYHFGPLSLANVEGFTHELLAAHPLEGGTRYGTVMRLLRTIMLGEAVAREAPLRRDLPIYALVLTDGQTGTKQQAIDQVVQSSLEPIFWQYVGIGKGGGDTGEKVGFGFLHQLDELPGRFVDNAGFFPVADLDAVGDEALYDQLMGEYPDWVGLARQKGMIP
jgi:stress response protein SCP2